jgi:hypothetical protein
MRVIYAVTLGACVAASGEFPIHFLQDGVHA